MKILAIETSCDDTAVAILEKKGESIKVLASNVSSQISLHNEYGGVFPMMAKREHVKNLVPVLQKTLSDAQLHLVKKEKNIFSGISKNIKLAKIKKVLRREEVLLQNIVNEIGIDTSLDIEYIAVTVGPGLPPTLWAGINFAKALSVIWNKKIIPVNHMHGHIVSVLSTDGTFFNTKNVELPALSLLVSGGHTEIVLVKDWGTYKILGKTKDDAVGEAFDKVARILSLPYPGGPEISKLADSHRQHHESQNIFPRPMSHTNDYDFSYSGLKTSVLYYTKENDTSNEDTRKLVAREFEDAAIDILVLKTKKAIGAFDPKCLIVGGGVSANKHLRERLKNEIDIPTHLPLHNLTGDNAVMIGVSAFMNTKKAVSWSSKALHAQGNLSI
ncbi:MAG: tRNA (adenosine(37)-N6)-threonylcarbamoyltransferase complex transferase subunit TsaD [Candidatus Paceibacterota bacterium]